MKFNPITFVNIEQNTKKNTIYDESNVVIKLWEYINENIKDKNASIGIITLCKFSII